MLVFIIRRLLQTIPVVFGVTLLVFLLVHLIPGDPAITMAGETAPPETIERMRERMGLNDPLPVQYLRYMGKLLQGDLGQSVRSSRLVWDEIKLRMGTTIELSLYSTIVSIIIGIFAGVISAVRKYSLFDTSFMVIAMLGLSMPAFWLGLMLIKLVAVDMMLVPPSGWGTWQQAVLPVITLGTGGAAIIARMTRSSMLDVINQDYIRTARSKGLIERVVIYRHALKNALIPVVTVIGIQIGFLMSGAIVVETVFAINGMGRLAVSAIQARDFPIVQGTVLIFALVFILANLCVDISYRYLNKRIELN